MPSGKNLKTHPSKIKRDLSRIARLLSLVGCVLLFCGLAIVFFTFWPIIQEELGFTIKHTILKSAPYTLTPVDKDFGIVIPKIEANAKVIAHVDPYDSRVYQQVLTRGVAHAKGTSVPGVAGNIFIFSHSSVNFYEAAKYNSIFYLLSKLKFGDPIDLYYLGKKYTYTVTSKRTVSKDAVQYLKTMDNNRETLTLMTCWPPGTSNARLLIVAERTSP